MKSIENGEKMKSIEFCYWLQGYFELAEPNYLNEKQTSLIKEHLKLVFQYDTEIHPFCSFLDGYLTVMQVNQVSQDDTNRIKKQLNNIFKHVIKQTPNNNEIEALC